MEEHRFVNAIMMRQQQQEQRDGHMVAVLGDTANDDISPGRAETNVADATTKNTNEMTTTTSMTSNDDRKAKKHTNTKNKKRKRLQEKQSLSRDEPEKQEQLAYQLLNDYYQRLIYQCHKDLNKHIKRTKNFLLQKQIRIIKEMTAAAATAKKEEGKEEATKNIHSAVQKQEVKLQQMKDCFNFPNNKTAMNEMILQECDRRLGIVQLDPKLLLLKQQQQPDTTNTRRTQLDMDDDNNDGSDDSEPDDDENTDICDNHKETATTATVPTPPKSVTASAETITAMMQRILQHKTVMTALERWHNEVTQYRIWSMQQQERLYHSDHKYTSASTFTTGGPATKKTKKGTNVKDPVSPTHHSTGSMFVSLGHDDDDDDDERNQEPDPDDPYSFYGPAGGGSGATKKNRQGQRGRRAKMAAMEAKKLGRSIPKEESINWRHGGSSSSSHTKSNHDHHRNPSNWNDDAPAAAQHKTDDTTATTTLHPSWQAKKESKAIIVAFQGTKITF